MDTFLFVVLLTLSTATALSSEDDSEESIEFMQECTSHRHCNGEGFRCIFGYCVCRSGYLVNPYDGNCIRCPTLGQQCFGQCCSERGDNREIHCWNGVCRNCVDRNGNWHCGDQPFAPVNHIILAASLLLGVIATFFVLYKLCSTLAIVTYRGSPSSSGNPNNTNRLSIGSMQFYLQQRLRDSPPKYNIDEASAPVLSVISSFENEGFVHDHSSRPPPSYAAATGTQTAETPEVLHI